jgi:hypothetical protein
MVSSTQAKRMPKVLSVSGGDVIIRFNDHRPAHVHIRGGGKQASFYLNCPDGPPALRENYGFSRAELNSIGNELGAALSALCEEWSKLHGDF